MNENEREQMRETLFDLLDIPEAEAMLLLKAGELERLFIDKLAEYRNLKNRFHKTGYNNLLIFKNKKPVKKLQAILKSVFYISGAGDFPFFYPAPRKSSKSWPKKDYIWGDHTNKSAPFWGLAVDIMLNSPYYIVLLRRL
jgi:hypothetical protein